MLVNTGRVWVAALMTQLTALVGIDMGVYDASHVWDAADDIGDLSIPGNAGFAAQTTSGWVQSGVQPDGRALCVATSLTFTNDSGGSITLYGVYYLTTGSGIFLGGVPFPTPIVVPNGETLQLIPNLSDTTG